MPLSTGWKMNYRNKRILALAAECPSCRWCGIQNVGQVVACHPNSIRYGKGMAVKAHDLVCYACNECHDILDGRAGDLTREQRDAMFLQSFYWTMLWLAQEGHLEIKG